ncbi:hypothetical protein EYC59_03615 [Candidatus Saccharibacteria bacterium]|nr:MAG: hypothetical protein EYC59_03615 [Candidatus Saccharibacteria bacterium]
MSEVKQGFGTVLKKIPVWLWASVAAILAIVGISAVVLANSNSDPKPTPTKAASNAQLYLTSVSESVNTGETFSVLVRLHPPKAVDGIETTVTYDQTKFEFVAIDSTGSAFPVKLQEEGGNGSVQVIRGIFAPDTVSSDSLVSTIRFKALKTTKNSELQVAGKASSGGSYLPDLTTGSLTLSVR